MAVQELVIDRHILWDSKSLKSIDEAKTIIMEYKRAGHMILKVNGEIMERFHPRFEELIIKTKKIFAHIMKILNDKGDDRLTWDKDNGQQAKEAKIKFYDLLKQGYMAFSVDNQSRRNKRIKEFDVDAEEILMVPKTVKA
jgi:hypothetical protein